MMRMHMKQLAFVVALGTAMAAGAQSPSYPAAAPATDKPAMAAPAKGDSDATKACANLPPAKNTPHTTTPSPSPSTTTAPAKSDSAPMKSDSAPAKSDTTTPPK